MLFFSTVSFLFLLFFLWLDEKLKDKKKKEKEVEEPVKTSKKKAVGSNLSEELQELKKEIMTEMRAELEEFKRDLIQGKLESSHPCALIFLVLIVLVCCLVWFSSTALREEIQKGK